jgi:hypothetical protein
MKQVIEELKTGRVRVEENSAPQCGRTESLIGKAIARLNLLSRAYQTKCG